MRNTEFDNSHYQFDINQIKNNSSETKKPMSCLCKGIIIGTILGLLIIGGIVAAIALSGGSDDKKKRSPIKEDPNTTQTNTDEIIETDKSTNKILKKSLKPINQLIKL